MKRILRRRPGPIFLILFCFVVSGTLRVGSQGMALAREGTPSTTLTDTLPQECPVAEPPEVGSLLAAINERQDQLAEQGREMAERRLLLNELEARMANQLDALRTAEARLASTLAIADSAAENDIARLTQVYEKMKPKNAALVFESMETSFAAGFLSRMKPEAAAGILSEMPSDQAYSVSVVMAGRNARAPTE